ncbi:MAG: hypothetical protein ACKVHU_07815 [Acidimicrobiales bacterium]
MTWLYLASLLFGGIFLIPMVLGGLDGDMDFDADVDLDIGADIDQGVLGSLGNLAGSLLSFRSIIFFCTFFGTTGLLIGWLTGASISTLITAVVLGLGAAGLQTAVFTRLKGSDTSSQLTSADLNGAIATVTVPLSGGSRGRVKAEIDGQPTFFIARPFVDGAAFNAGDRVVVVEVEKGIAAIIALD